jgi:hypothetical protein
MATQLISKANILKAVEEAIPAFVATQGMILNALDQIIPGEKDQAFLEERHNSRVRKAVKLYKNFHPEYGNAEPELHDVVDWLLARSGVSHVMLIENRMIQIAEILDKFGEVEIEQVVPVPGMDILRLRILATPLKGQGAEEAEESEEE